MKLKNSGSYYHLSVRFADSNYFKEFSPKEFGRNMTECLCRGCPINLLSSYNLKLRSLNAQKYPFVQHTFKKIALKKVFERRTI